MKYFTYILKSQKDSKHYIGHTGKDPHKRLAEHNQKSVFSTKGRTPFELIGYREFASREQAIQAEKKIKIFKTREVAQLASVLVWGTSGRGFESRLPDLFSLTTIEMP